MIYVKEYGNYTIDDTKFIGTIGGEGNISYDSFVKYMPYNDRTSDAAIYINGSTILIDNDIMTACSTRQESITYISKRLDDQNDRYICIMESMGSEIIIQLNDKLNTYDVYYPDSKIEGMGVDENMSMCMTNGCGLYAYVRLQNKDAAKDFCGLYNGVYQSSNMAIGIKEVSDEKFLCAAARRDPNTKRYSSAIFPISKKTYEALLKRVLDDTQLDVDSEIGEEGFTIKVKDGYRILEAIIHKNKYGVTVFDYETHGVTYHRPPRTIECNENNTKCMV